METLKNRLKRHEGFSPIIYRCPTGYWTIGYGHRIGAHYRISSEVADLLLDRDIHQAEFQYLTLGWNLNDARKDVIVEMIFWVGFRGLQKFRKMGQAIDTKDWAKAADELMDSQAGRNYPTRMNELAEIMGNGDNES